MDHVPDRYVSLEIFSSLLGEVVGRFLLWVTLLIKFCVFVG
jgi:hypothetical protein